MERLAEDGDTARGEANKLGRAGAGACCRPRCMVLVRRRRKRGDRTGWLAGWLDECVSARTCACSASCQGVSQEEDVEAMAVVGVED